jgi:hypothetical protein
MSRRASRCTGSLASGATGLAILTNQTPPANQQAVTQGHQLVGDQLKPTWMSARSASGALSRLRLPHAPALDSIPLDNSHQAGKDG